MKKLTALLLALLTIASVLASCSGDGGTMSDTSSAVTSTEAVDTTEAEETRIQSSLPEEYDLEGYTLTYFGADIEIGVDANNSDLGVFAYEENGDIINDAAFYRNQAVCEKYNCQLEYVPCGKGGHPINTVKPVILADDPAYDVLLEGAGHMPALASEGLIVDLNSLEYMDMSAPWWLQTVNETLSIGNKLYATIGSHMIRTKTFLYTVFFNYKLADDYGIDKDELYAAARDKTWTLDMLFDKAKIAKDDLNGDGKYDSNDLWGCSGESYCAYTLTYGAGVDYVTKDSDDIPHVTPLNEKNIGTITKVLEFMTNDDVMLVTNRITGVDNVWTTRTQMLISDQYMFFLGQPSPSAVRGMESDFGILPSPLYDETQDEYRHTTTVYNGTAFMIPVSAKDVETVGFISEALSYESYYSFLPAFYENFLETKYARDEDAVEMLQLIHNTIYYDLGGILVNDKFCAPINAVANSGTGADSITSKLTANIEAAETSLAKQLEKILK